MPSLSAAEIESILNRLSIFQGEQLSKCASELEHVAHETNLHRLMTPNLMKYLLDFASPGFPDSVVKASCLVIANSCTTDDLTNCRQYIAHGVAQRCESLLVERCKSASCVFAVLDVIATLCTGSREARDAFRPSMQHTLEAVRHHKTNLEILFAAVCALATQTLADPLSSLALARSNGLQVLVDIFKWSARQRDKQRSEEDKHLVTDTMKWAKQALLNTIRCPSCDVDGFFEKLQWGMFGDVVAVDELKVTATMERRKLLASMQQAKAQVQ
jgi:hypothetical protein